MKRKGKRILRTIFCALALCAVCGGVYYWQSIRAGSSTASASEYTPVAITSGSLNQSVISTGTISIGESEDVSVDFAVKLTAIEVQAGEGVKTGDTLALVDTDALGTTISALMTELAAQDSEIASLAGSYESEEKVKAPIAGRVKAIYAREGDDVQQVMDEYAALMLLSLDGYMQVSVPAAEGMAVGGKVKVLDGAKTYTGTVDGIDEAGNALILFSDVTTAPGATVRVTYNSEVIGSGEAQIHMPYSCSSTLEGTIDALYVDVNDKVTNRTAILYVTHIPTSADYAAALAARDTLLEKIRAAKAVREAGAITADFDGIVSSVNVNRNTDIEAGASLFTVYKGDATQMVISVDELDIINVSVGQTASIAMDAITDKAYSATVQYVSQLGTASSGVTNYSVTLAVEGDDNLKLGMNGTATIHVGEQSGVLLVPLTALQSDKAGQYVWLYDEHYTATADAPGVKTYVTTGLSNDEYAAVTAGLSAGDQVLIVRSAATAVTATQSGTGGGFGGGMTMMDAGSFAMPAGGSAPTGGERTNGGGRNRE